MEDNKIKEKLEIFYKKINLLIDEVYDVNKFQYNESNIVEYSSLVSTNSVNERIVLNRYKKINLLKELIPFWSDFKLQYSNDPILGKIGSEFINGKFDYDSNIKKTIEEYPEKKQVFFYLSKNQNMNISLTIDEYKTIKETILNDVLNLGQERILEKKIILDSISKIKGTNEFLNSFNLTNKNRDDFHFQELENPLINFYKSVNKGIFKINKKDKLISVEVPMKSIGKTQDNQHAILTFDFSNPANFIISPGRLDQNNVLLEHRIKIIRKQAEEDSNFLNKKTVHKLIGIN